MVERLSRQVRQARTRFGRRLEWLLPPVLAIEVTAATWRTDVPNGSGVRFWIVWLAISAAALAAVALTLSRRPTAQRLHPVEALALVALLAMALTDLTMAWQPLRDLDIYLRAGRHFLDGSPVYMQAPLAVQPTDRSLYPFLYPPCTLPFFGLLAILPEPLAQAVWVAGSLALGLLALRLIGLRGPWLLAVLVWPPFFQGLWVGNVALPTLLLFAVGPWLGAGLILGSIFKAYTGIATLWLLRERRWAQALIGCAILALAVVATLPLTGLEQWSKWLDGLGLYRTSQEMLPGLYGFGLPRFMPYAGFAALSLAAVVAALMTRGLDSLARFGTATVVASPSLFGHGLLIAVPSLLSLRTPWLWLAAGFLSTPDGASWWLAVVVIAVSWALPEMRRQPDAAEPGLVDRLHPLANSSGPWPDVRAGDAQELGAGARGFGAGARGLGAGAKVLGARSDVGARRDRR